MSVHDWLQKNGILVHAHATKEWDVGACASILVAKEWDVDPFASGC